MDLRSSAEAELDKIRYQGEVISEDVLRIRNSIIQSKNFLKKFGTPKEIYKDPNLSSYSIEILGYLNRIRQMLYIIKDHILSMQHLESQLAYLGAYGRTLAKMNHLEDYLKHIRVSMVNLINDVNSYMIYWEKINKNKKLPLLNSWNNVPVGQALQRIIYKDDKIIADWMLHLMHAIAVAEMKRPFEHKKIRGSTSL